MRITLGGQVIQIPKDRIGIGHGTSALRHVRHIQHRTNTHIISESNSRQEQLVEVQEQ